MNPEGLHFGSKTVSAVFPTPAHGQLTLDRERTASMGVQDHDVCCREDTHVLLGIIQQEASVEDNHADGGDGVNNILRQR